MGERAAPHGGRLQEDRRYEVEAPAANHWVGLMHGGNASAAVNADWSQGEPGNGSLWEVPLTHALAVGLQLRVLLRVQLEG